MNKRVLALGGTGLIGRHLSSMREVKVASPSTGVDAYTGVGLSAALEGIDTVVEITNPKSFSAEAAVDFFSSTTANLVEAARAAGVRHHVVLSVVGADRQVGGGYMSGKLVQEKLVAGSGIPFTIVRATQFHEFLDVLAQAFASVDGIEVPDGPIQTIAARDVAGVLSDVIGEAPANGIVDTAGPEVMSFAEAVGRRLAQRGNTTQVRTRKDLAYFGAAISEGQLIPAGDYRRGPTTLEAWAALN